jgi:UDP-GlcNAc:undecaprenyl-phosphate GlcNAc-1-phosphate transferase
MWTAGILLFLASAAISVALTPVVRRAAARFGFLDRPDEERKAHERPVPYGGGIAIFLAVVLPVSAAAVMVLWCRGHGRPAWVSEGVYAPISVHLGGAAKKLPEFAAVLAGGAVIFLLGLVDDRRRLGPFVKFAVQLAVAIAVVVAGVRVSVFLSSKLLGGVLSVLWIVSLTNTFNFLDNMDGLSAGVALIIAVVFLVVSIASGQLFIAAALIPFIGALAGFLPFNYSPARIFMGDAGSLFLGYYLAVLSVLFTYYSGPTVSLRPFLLPLIIFAVPIYDAFTVTIIRLREGRSPFSGDRRHLSHRLVAIGLSHRLAVGAIHLLTLGIGLAAVLLSLVQHQFGEAAATAEAVTIVQWVAIVQTLALLALVAVIERAIRS